MRFALALLVLASCSTGAADPPRRDQVRGIGSCKVDTDCVLSNDQSSCCTKSCMGYAINWKVLVAREAKQNCAAFHASGKPCPPPAPCPKPTHRSVGAACVRGACYTIREKL